MAGEAVLLYPRAQLQQGRFTDAMSAFYKVGERLLDDHVLFDVLPDDKATTAARTRYASVIDLSGSTNVIEKLPPGLSHFLAPATVRVSASRPRSGNEVTLHFVNYNRTEPADKKERGKGIADEKPIVVAPFEVDLHVPRELKAGRVEFLAPEAESMRLIESQASGGRIRFRVPEFLVYGVVHIVLAKTE